MPAQRPMIAPRWVHVGWPTAVIVFTALYVGMPGLIGDCIFLAGSLLPIGAIAIGLWWGALATSS